MPAKIDSACWKCPGADHVTRLAIFSRGHEVKAFGLDELCKNSSRTLDVELKPRKKVVVHVWLAHSDESTREEFDRAVRDEIVNADWVFNENGTGLTLELTGAHIRDLPGGNLKKQGDCDEAKDHPVFDPKVLNIFYGSGPYSACRDVPVIFTNGIGLLGDLAHEIAHSLGLQDGDHKNEYEQGHVNGIKGLGCTNMMFVDGETLEHSLTLGQAFWMNFYHVPSSLAKSPDRSINCATKVGAASNCIPLSTRVTLPQSERCRACTREQAEKLLVGRAVTPQKRVLNRILGAALFSPRYCTQKTVDDGLNRRFEILRDHQTKHKLPTQMGSTSSSGFRERWRLQSAIGLAIGALLNEVNNPIEDSGKSARLKQFAYVLNIAAADGPYAKHRFIRNINNSKLFKGTSRYTIRCQQP
ncbi:MAG: hypothetical protein ACRD8O_01815 [Bryobacteraceae bacterium]